MKRTGLLSLLLVVLLLFNGCAQSQPNNSANANSNANVSSTDTNSADTNKESVDPDKEYVFGGREYGLTSFDPHKNAWPANRPTMIQIYDTFFTYDENKNISPMLAESYEANEDCTVYTIRLREGVKFSNGQEMTAEDAKFTLDRASTSTQAAQGLAKYESCEIIDKYTIQVNMSSPDSVFPVILTDDMSNGVILCKDAVEACGTDFESNTYGQTLESLVTTGPYIITNLVYGEEATYEVNPHYWGEEPDIKKFRVKIINDTNSAAIALQSGEILGFNGHVASISIPALEANESLNVMYNTPQSFIGVAMNVNSDLFSNKDLRLAVCHGVDREKARTVATNGYGELAFYEAATGWTANPNYKEFYEFDQEKARELVKKSGMEGATFDLLTYAGWDAYENAVVAVADDLEAIGLKPNIVCMEPGLFDEIVWANKDYDIAVFGDTIARTDYSTAVACSFDSRQTYFANIYNYSNPEVDALIDKAYAEPDIEERANIYVEMLKLVNADAIQVPLCYEAAVRVYSAEFEINEAFAGLDRISDLHLK